MLVQQLFEGHLMEEREALIYTPAPAPMFLNS